MRGKRIVLSIAALGLGLLVSGLWATGLLDAPAAEAQRAVPKSRGAMQLSFAPVVKAATPAVVNVYVSTRVSGYVSPFRNDPVFGRFLEDFGMPRERVENSLGSGVIVSADGLIVTNAHVIKSRGTAEIRVVLSDRREFNARVIQQDKKTDIAILKIDGAREQLPFLRFADSDALEVGDLVLAIGNPFGVGQTVTSGIISALGRSQVGKSDNQVFIQTDAAINPGNSGGALVDMDGRLVGINTAIFSRSGGSNGIGFAIPANLVRLYVESASSGRAVARVWIGAKLQDVGRDIAQSLGLERVSGAIVSDISRGGPAASAGLRVGDVVTAVDGRDVSDARGARYRMTTTGVGRTAKLTILRNGRSRTVSIRLAALPKPSRNDVRLLRGQHPFDGVQVANPVPAVIDQLNVRQGDGVVVLGVRRDGYGASLGFRRGDVIVEVSGRRVATIRDLQRVLRRRQRFWEIAVRRGDRLVRWQVQG